MDSAKISSVRPADSAVPNMPQGDKAKVRYVAQQLEAIMITHMLRESHGKGTNFIDKSMAGGMFRDMLEDELAQNMSKAGAFGLADAIERTMAPRIEAEQKLKAAEASGVKEDPKEKKVDTTIHPNSHLPANILKVPEHPVLQALHAATLKNEE